jgi:hypothetical protein
MVCPTDARANGRHGDLRRTLARSLPADAIHYQECAARRVHPVAILVSLAHEAGIGGGSAIQRKLSHGALRR